MKYYITTTLLNRYINWVSCYSSNVIHLYSQGSSSTLGCPTFSWLQDNTETASIPSSIPSSLFYLLHNTKLRTSHCHNYWQCCKQTLNKLLKWCGTVGLYAHERRLGLAFLLLINASWLSSQVYLVAEFTASVRRTREINLHFPISINDCGFVLRDFTW